MATVAAEPTVAGEERFLLEGVSWDFYLRCCEELQDRRIRLTFNEGKLEFMITKAPHERHKKMLARMVEMMTYELDIAVESGGSMTIQRKDLLKGFEPDECWWIANEAAVRGKEEFDFRNDPPPDLAVEVEITSSLANRVGIYAAIGVPEIWRYDGKRLRFCLLQPDGEYLDCETSRAFPFLRPNDLMPFLSRDSKLDQTTRIRQFVEWFREQGFKA
jgi:Uma2 family endonuclease